MLTCVMLHVGLTRGMWSHQGGQLFSEDVTDLADRGEHVVLKQALGLRGGFGGLNLFFCAGICVHSAALLPPYLTAW